MLILSLLVVTKLFECFKQTFFRIPFKLLKHSSEKWGGAYSIKHHSKLPNRWKYSLNALFHTTSRKVPRKLTQTSNFNISTQRGLQEFILC